MILRLRLLRMLRGWSIKDVAEMTGIKGTDLSQLERGQKPAFPGWRKRLSQAFGLPEEALFEMVTEEMLAG
jgi:transcriptional regulator with XRE-family HTH domain